MRLLLDTCVWGGAKGSLLAEGHDVVWSGDWSEDPGDEEILARAYETQRVLITLDKDFGELAIIRNLPHCGILRLVNISAKRQAVVCSAILKRIFHAYIIRKILYMEVVYGIFISIL